MAKFRRNGKLKKFVAGALAVVLGVGAIAGISALVSNKADDDGKVKVNPSYSIGGLDDQGKYVESDATLYTKDAFECQGLTIKPKFDSNVEYQIFFYDEVGQFVESTDVLTTTYKDQLPFGVTHARLEITPVWGEDVKEKDQIIKWHNKHQWTNSLEIRVNDEQEELNLSSNLFSYVGTYVVDHTTMTFKEVGGAHFCDFIDFQDYKKAYLKMDLSLLADEKLRFYTYDVADTISMTMLTLSDYSYVEYDGYIILEIDNLASVENIAMAYFDAESPATEFKAIEIYAC